VVAHDWGGPVAFALQERAPAAVAGLAAVNAPHPRAWASLVADPASAQASIARYMLVFMADGFPQWATEGGCATMLPILGPPFAEGARVCEAWSNASAGPLAMDTMRRWYTDNLPQEAQYDVQEALCVFGPTADDPSCDVDFRWGPNGTEALQAAAGALRVPARVAWGMADTAFDNQAVLDGMRALAPPSAEGPGGLPFYEELRMEGRGHFDAYTDPGAAREVAAFVAPLLARAAAP